VKRYLGLAVAGCTLATLVVTPPPPALDARGVAVRHYLIAHHAGVAAMALLLSLAAIAIAALIDRWGVLIAAPTLVGAALFAALSHAAPTLDDSSTRLGYLAATYVAFVAPLFGAAVAVNAASWSGGRLWRTVSLAIAALAAAAAVAATLSAGARGAGSAFFARVLVALWAAWYGLRRPQERGTHERTADWATSQSSG
jgi:hypothetical protein